MSGVEALSVVANVIQVVQAGLEVYERLEQYGTTIGGLPETFLHISARMRLLVDVLKTTEAAIQTGALDKSAREALRPSMRQCLGQVEKLNGILKKCELPDGASRAKRTWKALSSFRYGSQLEKIDGQIQSYVQMLTHHASIAKYVRIEDRPRAKPCSTVPHRPDPHFIERHSITSQIETRLQGTAARVALVGLGGVGKSQLAIHYSHRFREKSPDAWVFWVNAGQTAAFEESLEKIAEKAQILAYDKTDKNRLQVVSEWLKNEDNQWLMIIDNADDLDVLISETPAPNKKARKESNFEGRPTQDLLSLLPQTSNGSYVVTSRNKLAASRIILGEYQNIVEVKEMDDDEATLLLKKRLIIQPEDDDAKELVEVLGRMPMAITQSAAYINEMSPRWTIRKYIEEFRKGGDDRAKLLDQDVYDARRDNQDKRTNSIIRTWQISFDRIRRKEPAAARLLSLMSLFDPVHIPEALLVGRYADFPSRRAFWKQKRGYNRRRPEETTIVDSNCNFDNDLRVLFSFQLISTENDGSHFAMHSLVQFATQRWIEEYGQFQAWTARYIRLLSTHFPDLTMGYKNTNAHLCQQWLGHAYTAMSLLPPDDKTLAEWALLVYKVAWFRNRQNYTTLAVDYMLENAMKALIMTVGWSDTVTLRCATSVGVRFALRRREHDAELLHRKILKIRQRDLGPAHPDTLATMDNLMDALNKQGKRDESDVVYEQSISLRMQKYGLQHQQTQTALEMQVLVLMCRHDYKAAERLARFALDARKQKNGNCYDHTWSLNLGTMAASMHMTGQLQEAEAICREIVTYTEETLGKDHRETLLSIKHLSSVLSTQEKFGEVEILTKRLMHNEADWGDDEKLATMFMLAWALLKQNKPEEAEYWARAWMEKITMVHGEEHEDIACAEWVLAGALRERKQFDEALRLFQKAYKTVVDKHGESHADAKLFLPPLTSLLDEMGLSEEQVHTPLDQADSAPKDPPALGLTGEGRSENPLPEHHPTELDQGASTQEPPTLAKLIWS